MDLTRVHLRRSTSQSPYTMSSKYHGLPDIVRCSPHRRVPAHLPQDTAPDVFETIDEPEIILRPVGFDNTLIMCCLAD